MVQQTFTDMEYANRNRTTKREAFLDAMESIIPWKEWMELIAPFYVQKGRGRKLIPLETMLRMYLMQNWFGLSDEGIEDAIYDSYAMKRFLKIEHEKTSIRCKVEHPFLIVKRLFQAGRTRYRGIKKNLLRYYLLFASANLVMCLRAGRQRVFCMTMG